MMMFFPGFGSLMISSPPWGIKSSVMLFLAEGIDLDWTDNQHINDGSFFCREVMLSISICE